MMLLSFSETNTSFDPPSAHFLAQSALSMSLAPHFSSLTQPLILVALGALSLANDTDEINASANITNRSFFMVYRISSEDFIVVGKTALRRACLVIEVIERRRQKRLQRKFAPLAPGKGTVRSCRIKTTSSLAPAQRVERKECKQPRRGGHNEVAHVLLFQWFWGRSLKL